MIAESGVCSRRPSPLETALSERMKPSQNEAGAALVVGLIVLGVLALLGITGMRDSTMQERMAGNELDRAAAFEVAEAAVRGGEWFLSSETLPKFDGTGAFYEPAAAGATPVWKSAAWSNADSESYTDGVPAGAEARFVIEELGATDDSGVSLSSDSPVEVVQFYRVTGRGSGLSGTSEVLVQSIYKR